MNQNDINHIYALTQAKIITFPKLGLPLRSFFGISLNPQIGQFQKIPTPKLKFGGSNYECIQVTKAFIHEGHTNYA